MTSVIPSVTRPARPAVQVSRIAAALLWLVIAGTTVLLSFAGGDDWQVPYALFAVNVVAALGTTAWFAITASAGADRSSTRRVLHLVAAGIVVLGVVAAVVLPWAVVLWEAVVGLGLLGLAATAGRPVAWWLAAIGVVLLAGVGLSALAVELRLGDPGSDQDFGQAQGWALAITAVAAAVVLSIARVNGTADGGSPR